VPGATSATGQPLTYQLLYQGVCPGAIGSCPPYNATNYGLSPVYPLNSKDAQNYGFAFVGSTADQPIPYPFINTGAEFLNYFNIIYDPVSGFFGYQESPTAVPNATNFPALNESIAIQGMTTIPGGTVVSMPTLLFAEFIDGYSGTAGPQTVVQLSSPGQVTMSGVISSAIVCGSDTCVGTGLEIAGGTFVLTANNAYLGGTTIDPGATLALAGAGSIAASAGVAANGNFDISGTAAGAQIAALSGTGTVNLGGQTLTLANASGVYGGTIADGGMAGGAGGSLVIAGGVQVLTGVNTYTGSTTITGGAMLAVNADAALGAATAPLIFNDGTLLALGDIVGTRPIVVESGGGVVDANGFTVSFGGPLTVNGPFVTMGTVVLGGNTTIGSDFTVSNGLLSVNGALQAPSLTVSPGATLRGTGTIGAPTTVAGTLAAGNSPGTLHFTAPVTLLPGAVSQFDIDGPGTGTGAGNYSRVLVSGAGNSFTAAGTLAPLLRGITGSATNSYTPPLGQVFQVVAAQGGVQGVYAGLTQPAGLGAGTRMDVLYGPTTIALAVTPQAYGALAQAGLMETANQSAVGSALDAMRPAAGAPMTPAQQALYAPLYPLPGAAIAPTLDALSPAIDADAMMVWRGAWYAMSDAVGAALETRRGGQPDAQQQVADGPRGSTLWVTALGQFGSVGSADGVPGYSGSSGGVAAGIDLPVLPNLTAGAALGFVSPQVSSTNGQDVWGQALQMTVYASLHQGIWFADAQAGGLFFQDNTTRPLPAYGAQAQGQTGGAGGGGSLRAGARLDAAAWRIQPSAGLTGLGLSRRGFTETQAGAADLSLGSAGLASVQSVLAVRAERRLALGATPFGEGLALVPTARLGWAHEFADTRGTVSAAFAGGPGASFGAHSAAVGRDAALIGLGATLLTAGPVSFDLAYSGAFAQNTNAQTLTGTVSVKW
jgi:autotransporter-associated beta strand protein